ncbi:hypothetical protein DV451_004759 [Geotrichum candidum]|uniref:Uncharacterized protein n=1 Tax=Geotrichum candidum TaxID=1173061 RepID=A0A9P5G1E6_GEOCN|nr:hypothetical protein DV451_004759 [Geotrichum candidum]KAF5109733.1 hypothetical protein DV453_001339 [Geotrichum candidum]
MLKLENKSNLKTSPPTGGSGLAGVNLSHLNRNSATTTTTLLSANPTPSTGVFPSLRTPKDIVLQDIAVQCISPALPSFGSSVMDAMARSKTIQEEQRRLIAERRRLNGDSDNDGDDVNDDETKSQTEKQIIVSENSNVIIESVPTPTETRLQYNPSALKDHNRKPRPKKIELFPYHKGPSIRSAPIINNAAAAARRVYVQPPHARGGPQQHLGGRAPLARQWPIREEEFSDDSDESMRDPEDAALSDSDVETKAIAEEDELMAASRKRKREKTFAKLVQSAVDVAGAPKPRPLAVHHPVPHQAHKPPQPEKLHVGPDRKRQRFLELCGELWDMFNE